MGEWVEKMDDSCWFEEQTAAVYIRQVLVALAHCHAAQVYHRDLRPSSLCLTSRLPDALVRVSDFGVAEILDPGSSVARRNPSPYNAPELLGGKDDVHAGAVDMWSVGALAYALLVGHPPYCGPAAASRSRPTSQDLMRLMRSPPRFSEEGWASRSDASRDFVRRLLRPAAERPTAAQALHHPWVRGLGSGGLPAWHQKVPGIAGVDVEQDMSFKSLCYMLAVLLVPVLVPTRDFEELRAAFLTVDTDRDGYATRGALVGVLRGRIYTSTSDEAAAAMEAVAGAISIADVPRTDVLDLCGAAVADLIAREFFASGPSGSIASSGMSLSAADLAPRMLNRFFEVFGGRQRTVTLPGIVPKLRTAVARGLESNANVRFDEIIAVFPQDRYIDAQVVTGALLGAGGRGTPLEAPMADPDRFDCPGGPWSCNNGTWGIDVTSLFRTCAFQRREASPHSLRVF